MCVERICPRLLRSSAGLSPVSDLLMICNIENAHSSNAHAMTTDVSTVFAFCCVQGFQDIRPRTSDGGESFYSLSVAVRMRYKFRRSNPCDARGSHGLAPHKPLVVSRTSGRSAGGYRSASARPSRVFFATVGRISMVCMCSHALVALGARVLSCSLVRNAPDGALAANRPDGPF